LQHRAYRTPLGWSVFQRLELDGVAGAVDQHVFLPDEGGWIECDSAWHMGLTTHPEAVYVAFPFNLPDAVARYDLGGQAVIPGQDQLPGVCRDYFTAQGWIDFSSAQRGMTIALPENPLFQLGDFHFGDYQQTFHLGRALFLSWVTTNYWETNFRAHQPGLVHARYRLYPHAGGFDEAQAHQWGLETLYSEPLVQPLGEPRLPPLLPPRGTLLRLPQPPILVLHVKPGDGGIVIRLLNTSDSVQTAVIASGLIQIASARLCDLMEEPQAAITVSDGRLSVELPPRQISVLHIEVAPRENPLSNKPGL
jgi:hypothetical protein